MNGTDAESPRQDEATWLRSRFLVVCAIGGLLTAKLIANGFRDSSPNTDAFLRFIALSEPAVLAGMLGWLATWSPHRPPATTPDPEQGATDVSWWWVASVALGVTLLSTFVATALGASFPLSGDEYVADLHASVIASGRLLIDVPDAWRPVGDALRPIYVLESADGATWVPGYLPGYALLRAAFVRLDLGWLCNPVLTGLSVVAVAGIARNRWPGARDRQRVAVLALASSSQVVAMGGTGYSMPAHLALNLLWLWGFTGGRRGRLAAGPIGAFASLLHQPVPHPLFALPFLFRLVRERAWRRVLWHGAWYAGAIGVFVWWSTLARSPLPLVGPAGVFWWPGELHLLYLLLYALVLLSWQTPIAGALLLLGTRRWRALDGFGRDLLAGIGASLVFYLFFRLVSQSHGWGWRYGHQVIGNVALLAGCLWPTFTAAVGPHAARRALAASLLVTVALQFPVRGWLVRRFTLPWATANARLDESDAKALIIPADSIWYGVDLIRNAPGRRVPVRLRRAVLDASPPRMPGSVADADARRLSVRDLTILGLEPLHAAPRRR